jgi:hypothetical protein
MCGRVVFNSTSAGTTIPRTPPPTHTHTQANVVIIIVIISLKINF